MYDHKIFEESYGFFDITITNYDSVDVTYENPKLIDIGNPTLKYMYTLSLDPTRKLGVRAYVVNVLLLNVLVELVFCALYILELLK